jgi:hypothetical protein
VDVSVQRLVHRGRARDVVRDRIGLEDALGTALPENGRLVLVRKLTVRGEVADPLERQNAVRRGWVEAVSDAVHATSSFAGRANCVWFASRAEAEAILLAKLLAGEPVAGWFWQLAVPDWTGLPIAEWLLRRIARAFSQGHRAALVGIARACVDAGRIELFIQAADRAAGSAGTSEAATSVTPGSLVQAAEGSVPGDPAREALVLELAGKLLPRVLPPVWRELIAAIAQAEAGERTKHRLTAAILTERVRRASPALALQPQLMRDIADASFEAAAGRLTLPPAGAGTETAGHRPAPAAGEARPLSPREEVARPTALSHEPAPPREEPPSRTEPRHRPRSTGPEPADPERPPTTHSRHEGLWLVVPSLIRNGIREWLTQPSLVPQRHDRPYAND